MPDNKFAGTTPGRVEKVDHHRVHELLGHKLLGAKVRITDMIMGRTFHGPAATYGWTELNCPLSMRALESAVHENPR